METHAEAISILGRVGVPNDVANAVGFLAGPDSDFITGQVSEDSFILNTHEPHGSKIKHHSNGLSLL